jgi:dTMP kinase
MVERGKFIVLEGIDGAGTTSMRNELRDYLLSRDMPVETTQEPYSELLEPLLRMCVQGEVNDPGWRVMSLLFTADRLIHCRDLGDVLEGGMNVVCDRFHGSTAAYQSALANLKDADAAMNYIMTSLSSDILTPDLTLFLKADVSVCAGRRASYRNVEDYYERLEFQERVAKSYDKWVEIEAQKSNKNLVVIVDANRSYDLVRQDCQKAVDLVVDR